MEQLAIHDINAFRVAQHLVRWHGDDAVLEAASQADHSKALGNQELFIHWRAVEHAIQVLQLEEPLGEIH